MPKTRQEILQDSMYALLCEFDRICRKHSIEYFLYAGTLLGAVRHKDLIPWDDDVDIIMARDQLARLDEVIRDELPARFKWVMPREREFFLCFQPHFLDLETPYEIAGNEEFLISEYARLDIFTMDKAPNSRLLRELRWVDHSILHGLGIAHRPTKKFTYPHNYSWYMFCVAKVLQFLGRFCRLDRIYDRWDRMGGRFSAMTDNEYVTLTNESPANRRYYFFKSRVFAERQEFTIRDGRFYGPAGWEEMLTQMYGDYLQLPPESERVNKHLPE